MKGSKCIAQGLAPGEDVEIDKTSEGRNLRICKLRPFGALIWYLVEPGVKTPGYINCTLSGCCPRMRNCEIVDFVNTLSAAGFDTSRVERGQRPRRVSSCAACADGDVCSTPRKCCAFPRGPRQSYGNPRLHLKPSLRSALGTPSDPPLYDSYLIYVTFLLLTFLPLICKFIK